MIVLNDHVCTSILVASASFSPLDFNFTLPTYSRFAKMRTCVTIDSILVGPFTLHPGQTVSIQTPYIPLLRQGDRIACRRISNICSVVFACLRAWNPSISYAFNILRLFWHGCEHFLRKSHVQQHLLHMRPPSFGYSCTNFSLSTTVLVQIYCLRFDDITNHHCGCFWCSADGADRANGSRSNTRSPSP